jgi:hypothetical protein
MAANRRKTSGAIAAPPVKAKRARLRPSWSRKGPSTSASASGSSARSPPGRAWCHRRRASQAGRCARPQSTSALAPARCVQHAGVHARGQAFPLARAEEHHLAGQLADRLLDLVRALGEVHAQRAHQAQRDADPLLGGPGQRDVRQVFAPVGHVQRLPISCRRCASASVRGDHALGLAGGARGVGQHSDVAARCPAPPSRATCCGSAAASGWPACFRAWRDSSRASGGSPTGRRTPTTRWCAPAA